MMMMLEVPQDIIDRLNNDLKKTPEQIPGALRKTINSVAKYGRKAVERRIMENYVLEDAPVRVKAASEYESARGKQFNATILIKGSPEPLMHFQVIRNAGRESAKAKVLQHSHMKDLAVVRDGKTLKAFVQTMENEHVGVFRRMDESEKREQQNYFNKQAKAGKKQKTTKRNAIKQLYSTSIPQMVKNDKVYSQIEKDIKEEMHRTLAKHIATVMEGMR